MGSKDIEYSTAVRQHLTSGLNTLANTVKVTLGPRGRNVVLERPWGSPTITKDGVTVASEIELGNRFANLGAQMVKEVASQTSEVAGDGTTTATVLAQAIFAEGAKLLSAGANPMELKRGIDAAVETVVRVLKRQSRVTEGRTDITQVATISANGDEAIGDLIAQAMDKVGKEGVVTLQEGTSMVNALEFVEGMEFDRGYLSPYFITDTARMEVVLDDPYILVYGQKISGLKEFMPLLEQVAQASRPLLVIAEDVEGEALAALVVNRLRGSLKVCAVKAPSFGDQRAELLKDIAALTGAQAVTTDMGLKLENLTLEDLGRAKSVRVGRDSTTLVQGLGDKRNIQGRIKQVRAQLDAATSDHDRQMLQGRLAKIQGGVAVITIGAATETELKERKGRFEDALHATRAALEEGIVPGGGVALLRSLPALAKLKLDGEQQYGVNIIRRAIEEPLRQMAENGGVDAAVVVSKVRSGKGAFGYNVASGKYEDLMRAGVIDPTKVVRVALQNAASVASMMLTTETLIAEHDSAGDEGQALHGHHG